MNQNQPNERLADDVHRCDCGAPIRNPKLDQCTRCWRERHDADLDRRDNQRSD